MNNKQENQNSNCVVLDGSVAAAAMLSLSAIDYDVKDGVLIIKED